MTRYLVPFALMGLAACNGAPMSEAPKPADPLTRGEIARISEDIFEGVRFETATPKHLVPTTGRAEYSGTLRADLQAPGVRSDLAALIDMGVDFRTEEVGGIVGNFVESDGDQVDGILTLRGGRLDRRANSREVAIFSGMAGRLIGPGGERIDVDADLSGGFAGRSVDYIGAEFSGDVIVDGRRGTIEGATALEGR